MKKTILTLTMILMFTILVTACDKDKKNDVNTSQKATTNKSEKVEVKTTVVEVTDSTGEPVTNAKGEKVTQVVTIPPTTKKDKSKQDTTTTTKSNTPTTTKAPPKNTTTRPVTQPPKAPTTTKPKPVNPPTTQPTQPQNPYGYVNAWGTLAQMESDCKAYAQSIGLIYKDDFNLGNGHWATPTSSYGATSSQTFKNKIFRDVKEHQDLGIGITDIRVLFVTLDNYKDGRCGTNPYVIEDVERLLFSAEKDVLIYYITN